MKLRGFSPLPRIDEAADGWLYFLCPDDVALQTMFCLPEFAGMVTRLERVDSGNALSVAPTASNVQADIALLALDGSLAV